MASKYRQIRQSHIDRGIIEDRFKEDKSKSNIDIGSVFGMNSDSYNRQQDGFNNFLSNFTSGAPKFGEPAQPQSEDFLTKFLEDTNDIIGLPPQAYSEFGDPEIAELEKIRALQSMIVMELIPCWPSYSGTDGDKGMSLFTLNENEGNSRFKELLSPTGVKPFSLPLKVAVNNDVSISESWSNDWGESMFEDMANIGSTFGQEVRFITGKDNVFEGLESIGKNMGGLVGQYGGKVGETIGTGMNLFSGMVGGAGNVLEGAASSAGGLWKGAMQLASGSKVDFPQIWRGSSYTPSYSFTIILYNPNPSDYDSYMKYIVRPLLHMVAFMTPMSDSNFTFGFPVACKVKCPGLFGLDAGFIQSLDVVKGGSNNDITFYQRPSTVEIRFTFGSLYTTMIGKSEDSVSEERPTINSYASHLRGETTPPSFGSSRITAANIDGGGVSIINEDPEPPKNNILDSSRRMTAQSGADLVGRLSPEAVQASTDPTLNDLTNIFTIVDREVLTKVTKYTNDVTNIIDNIRGGGEIKVEDRIALQLQNGLPIPPDLENWFWNNIDRYDSITKNIIENMRSPGITPLFSVSDPNFSNNISSGNNISMEQVDSF